MKRLKFLFIFLTPFLFSFKIGEKVKLFELRDIDGNWFQLRDYCGEKPKADVIILDFFSTDCAPCIRAIGILKKIKADYKRVEVFLISFKESERNLRKFFKESGFPFKILMDKYGDTARDYGVVGLPHTIILDGSCVWRDQIIGEMSEHEKVLREKIEKILRFNK
jgi:peroxiredoxin